MQQQKNSLTELLNGVNGGVQQSQIHGYQKSKVPGRRENEYREEKYSATEKYLL